MGRKSVSHFRAHSSSMEKEEGEEVVYMMSSSTNRGADQMMVSSINLKPAVHPLEPLNEDQPTKFPMPALSVSLSMEGHRAEPSSKQNQKGAQQKMNEAKPNRNFGSTNEVGRFGPVSTPDSPKGLYNSSLYFNKFQ